MVVIGATVALLFTTERDIASRRSVLRAFDLHAREAASALADARAGQQGYVASGQNPAVWMPKVSALVQEVAATVDALRAWAASDAARQALLEASAGISDFSNIDKRVREYLTAREPLMASDVVYSEGGAAAGRAGLAVEAARLTEHRAADDDEASSRRLEAYALGGAAGWSILVLLGLSFARDAAAPHVLATAAPSESDTGREARMPQPAGAEVKAAMQAAAALCTDLGRMQDAADLKPLLGRAAHLLDASGLVLWVGDAEGSDLRPLASHGYADHVLSLMHPVPRLADNAAAAAYRTGLPQVVASGPGEAPGAIAAPLLSAEGCVGALTAEIRGGAETSAEVQALAALIAAQLAGALAPPAADALPQPKTASA